MFDRKQPQTSFHEGTKANYRPDIDGLRALAVLLVVIYHGFPDSLNGGFLGVDVFFTLSGFLITKIIRSDLTSDHFSLRKFYFNRIRRILPSLLIVMTTFLATGWLFFRADEFAQLGNEVLAGSLFYSNFFYLSQDNYFDVASELKPLLHLWSLSIEEQFYVLYPIGFILLNKISRSQRIQMLVIATSATASFVICFVFASSTSHAFFLPITRWWELLLGGVLALSTNNGRFRVSNPNLVALGGFGCIAIGVVFASIVESFLVHMGLIVVFGTLILIAVGQDSRLVKLTMGRKPLVEIGKISYAFYLWHWPILVTARILNGGSPSGPVRFTLLSFAFLLSWLTTRFIEKPIRLRAQHERAVALLSAGLLLVGTAGWFVSSRDGVPGRDANNNQVKFIGDTGQNQFHRYISDNFFPCVPEEVFTSALSWEGYVRCNQSKDNEQIEVLLLGDSHAEHLFIGLAETLKNENVGFYIGAVAVNRSDPKFEFILNETVKNPSIKTVILGAMWTSGEVSTSGLVAVMQKLLESGKHVFVTDGIPVYGETDPDLCKFRGKCPQGTSYSEILKHPSYLNLFAALKAVPAVTLIKTYEHLCSGSKGCSMHNDQQILYRDPIHLNILGSQFIGQKIVEDHPLLLE